MSQISSGLDSRTLVKENSFQPLPLPLELVLAPRLLLFSTALPGLLSVFDFTLPPCCGSSGDL